jgi:hypothetical protein
MLGLMDIFNSLHDIQDWYKNWGFLVTLGIYITIPTILSLGIPHFLDQNFA